MWTDTLPTAWVFVVLGDTYDSSTHSWSPNGLRMIRTPDFWLVLAMTVLYVLVRSPCMICSTSSYSVVIPWFTVRAVKVEAEIVCLFHHLLFLLFLMNCLSLHPRLWFYVSNAGCSKVSWRGSAEVLFWSTTPSGSYREPLVNFCRVTNH